MFYLFLLLMYVFLFYMCLWMKYFLLSYIFKESILKNIFVVLLNLLFMFLRLMLFMCV